MSARCPTTSGPYRCDGSVGHPPPCETVQPSKPWVGPALKPTTRVTRPRQDECLAAAATPTATVTKVTQDANTAEQRLCRARERRERLLAEAADLEVKGENR
jgi:hypothetical protein